MNLTFSSIYLKVNTLLIAISILTACQSSPESSIPIINIEEGVEQGHTLPLSDFCTSIEYIPLQTHPDALIGNSPSLHQLDNYFYILNLYKDESGKLFDKNGKFIRNIGSKGRASGEFSQILGFQIETDRSYIAIRDYRKIVRYNKEGKFVNELLFDKIKDKEGGINSMLYLKDGKYCMGVINVENENHQSAIIIIDEKGDILFKSNDAKERYIDIKNIILNGEVIRSRSVSNLHTYLFKDSIQVVSSNTDTIYSFSQKLQKRARFTTYLGKYRQNEDLSNRSSSINLIHSSFMETSDRLFFKFVSTEDKFSYSNPNGRIEYAIYDKKSGKVKPLSYDSDFETTGFKNDLDNGAPFWPQIIRNKSMYQIIDAMDFIQLSKTSKSAEMKKVAEKLTEDSNPVIVAITLK